MHKLLRFLMLVDDDTPSGERFLPNPWQLVALTLLGAALWCLVAVHIRAQAEAGLQVDPNPVRGLLLALAKAPLGGFISIWLCRFVARLSLKQLLAGQVYIGGVLMLADGAVVKWFPAVYGYNEAILRQTAGELLWGYAIADLAALIWVYWGLLRRQRLTDTDGAVRA